MVVLLCVLKICNVPGLFVRTALQNNYLPESLSEKPGFFEKPGF